MMAVHGQSFVDVALVSEIVSRAGGDVGPRRGFLYYLEVWPADLLPWTPFFLLALGYFALARSRVDAGERRSALLLAVWFLVVVGAFSFSSSKLPHYILPAYPAAALLVGLFVDRAGTDAVARRFWWAGDGPCGHGAARGVGADLGPPAAHGKPVDAAAGFRAAFTPDGWRRRDRSGSDCGEDRRPAARPSPARWRPRSRTPRCS